MKKIIMIISILFTFFAFGKNSFAETNEIRLGDVIPGVHLHLKTPTVEKNKNMYQIRNITTGELVYCIEPGVMLVDGSFTKTSFYQKYNLTQEDWFYLSYLTYFGYGYKEHTDIKWYVVTQYLIWDYILKDTGEVYFINEQNEKISLYEEEILQMKQDIASAFVTPSFLTNDFTPVYFTQIGEELVIYDENKVLNDYTLTINGNPLTSFNNEIRLTFDTPGTQSLQATRILDFKSITYLFYNGNSQIVMSRGLNNIPGGFVFIEVEVPDLTIIKKASEPDLSVKGTKFALYLEDGTLYNTYEIDESGLLNIKSLWPGVYYLEEIEVPAGFVRNEEKMLVEVKKAHPSITIENQVIKKNVTIEKYLAYQDGTYELESNAEFELYRNGALLKTISTNEFGKVTLSLSYGDYTLKQMKGTKGFLLSEDISFTINDKYLENPIIIKNQEIVGTLTIQKVGEDQELILEPTKFEIQKKETNQVLQNGELPYFETTNGTITISNLPYGIYMIKEIESPEGYQKDDETYLVSIDSLDTKTISIINQKVAVEEPLEKEEPSKGILELQKLDYETNLPLQDVKFQILDKENQVIGEYKTDENGMISLELEPGTYHIIEVTTLEEYELEQREVTIELKENTKSTVILTNRKKIKVPNTGITEIDFVIYSMPILYDKKKKFY